MAESKSTARRWLQFSLRTLLLAMLVVAVFFAGREWERRMLEAERSTLQQQAEAMRRKAETAAAELRLMQFALEFSESQVKSQKVEQELRAELDRLERRAGLNSTENSTLRSRWPQPSMDRLKRQVVPVNEFWQRPKRSGPIRQSPQVDLRPVKQSHSMSA